MNGKAQAEAGSREHGCSFGERVAQCLHGESTVRGTEGLDREAQFGGGDIDVSGGVKQFVQEGAPLFVAANVVWSEKRQEVALGLKGEHLDEVREVLALGGELDDGTRAHLTDFDALRECVASPQELGELVPCDVELLANLGVGDFEAAHGGTA